MRILGVCEQGLQEGESRQRRMGHKLVQGDSSLGKLSKLAAPFGNKPTETICEQQTAWQLQHSPQQLTRTLAQMSASAG